MSVNSPDASVRLPRSVPLPGSPSPRRVIGPPGRPAGPPPSMVAAVAPLAWAAVGTTSSRAAKASAARTRGFMVGSFPVAGGRVDRGTPGRTGRFPFSCGRRASACPPAAGQDSRSMAAVVMRMQPWLAGKAGTEEPELASWAVNELRSTVTAVEGYAMGELFDSYISNNGLLVLLDGLDEVSSEAYERTATAIRALSRRLEHASSENAIILTMRTQFHQQVRDDFADDFPPTLYIRAFSPGEIYTFLNRWPFRHNKARAITRIYSDLTDRPTLREMCSNPLVLAMYVAHDQTADVSGVPDTRTAFYSTVTEELLVARRGRQLKTTTARTSLREQREAILGRLALDHLLDDTQPANS